MFIEAVHPQQLEVAEQRNFLASREHCAPSELNVSSDSSAINISSLRDLRNNR
jgi:hypothetical protein